MAEKLNTAAEFQPVKSYSGSWRLTSAAAGSDSGAPEVSGPLTWLRGRRRLVNRIDSSERRCGGAVIKQQAAAAWRPTPRHCGDYKAQINMRKRSGGFSSLTETRRKKNTQRSQPECDFTLTGCDWGSRHTHTATGHHWCVRVLHHWLLPVSTVNSVKPTVRLSSANMEHSKGEFPPFSFLLLFTVSRKTLSAPTLLVQTWWRWVIRMNHNDTCCHEESAHAPAPVLMWRFNWSYNESAPRTAVIMCLCHILGYETYTFTLRRRTNPEEPRWNVTVVLPSFMFFCSLTRSRFPAPPSLKCGKDKDECLDSNFSGFSADTCHSKPRSVHSHTTTLLNICSVFLISLSVSVHYADLWVAEQEKRQGRWHPPSFS